MVKIRLLLAIAFLLAVATAQLVNLSQIFTPQTLATLGPEYSNNSFITLIDNYFGCANWTNGFCAECSVSYFFNKNGICCQVDPNCQNFNRDVGICQQCYQGYSVISNGSCTQTDPGSPQNVGCAIWQNGVCTQCSVRYYNFNGNCTPVSDQCREWNQTTGACTKCYNAYSLNSNGQCLIDNNLPLNQSVSQNPYCTKWNPSGVCLQCAQRAYFDSKGICQKVNAQCNTWDRLDGFCLSCYKGYDFVNGTCVYSPSNNAPPSDLGCELFNGSVCLQCSTNWVFNSKAVCVPVSDECKTHDNSGNCVTCYAGYELKNGSCVYSPANNLPPTDGGCYNWNWNNAICTECSKDWVFNSNGICIPVNDQCRTYNNNTGVCTSCYKGYNQVNGSCVYSSSNTAAPTDPGCKIWNWANNTCSQCSADYFLRTNGICQAVNAECESYNSTNGLCTSCYKGYDLVNGSCVYSNSNTTHPSDLGCTIFNGTICIQCSKDWVFNAKGVCIPVSDECKTSSSNGNCLSCYLGYDLINGTCVYSSSNTQPPTDGGCRTWNYTTKNCSVCSFDWVFNNNGLCTPVNDQCKTHNNSGNCLSCYRGYDLVNNTCVYSPSNTAPPNDSGCNLFNGTTCLSCSQGWALGSNGVCARVSDQCKTSSGLNCTSCYVGYVVLNGSCVPSILNLRPTDAGCKIWNWNNQTCLQCSPYWVLLSGVCVPVSAYCNTYNNSTGNCITCYKGYDLVNGTCVLSTKNQHPADSGCADWNWDEQICLTCSPYYVLLNGTCESVSPECLTYNSTGQCTSCFKGYQLTNGTCVVVPSICKTQDSTGCLSCYSGYALYQKNCVALSNLANIALYYAECCPQKLATLRAEGRIPQ